MLFRLSVLVASAAASAAAAAVCVLGELYRQNAAADVVAAVAVAVAACGPFGHSVEFSRVSVKTQPTAIWWHIRSMATVWITGARFVLLSHIISGIIVIGIVRSI